MGQVGYGGMGRHTVNILNKKFYIDYNPLNVAWGGKTLVLINLINYSFKISFSLY